MTEQKRGRLSGQMINRSTLRTGQLISRITLTTKTAFTLWGYSTGLCGMMWDAIAATTTLAQRVSYH